MVVPATIGIIISSAQTGITFPFSSCSLKYSICMQDTTSNDYAFQGSKTDIHAFSLQLDKRNCFCHITYCLTTKFDKCFTVWCWNLMSYLFKKKRKAGLRIHGIAGYYSNIAKVNIGRCRGGAKRAMFPFFFLYFQNVLPLYSSMILL